jgi:hypothetical protein
MGKLVERACIAACAVGALLVMATAGYCATIFYDSFEPSVNSNLWTIGPVWWQQSGHHVLEGEVKPRTPGVNGLRAWINWRYPYNSQRSLGASYDSNIYVKCWIWEDNDATWPPDAGHQYENWPNGYLTLANSAWIANPAAAAGDACMIGVMGEVGRANGALKDFFDNCCVYTTTDYYQVLNGDEMPLVPRRQGWRKYTILVNGYTGNPGDVQFLIDDKVVYNGLRKSLPGGGGAAFDTVILGSQKWTIQNYYFDQAECGTIETPINCGTISDANALPDETWVSLSSKVVSGWFGYSDRPNAPPFYDIPFPGYVTIEEDNRSAALWVSSSYVANVSSANNLAERINVKGIMRTNEAGMRYLDAIEITHASDPVDQPRALGTSLRSVGSPLLDGKLVKVWGKVVNIPGSDPATVLGHERAGDWRGYFMIDDGSFGGPVKCYYNNIIVAKPGIDPIPAVKNGDYVSVVGVAGREVLVPGTTGPEKSVWIRGAGDLKILRAAP